MIPLEHGLDTFSCTNTICICTQSATFTARGLHNSPLSQTFTDIPRLDRDIKIQGGVKYFQELASVNRIMLCAEYRPPKVNAFSVVTLGLSNGLFLAWISTLLCEPWAMHRICLGKSP